MNYIKVKTDGAVITVVDNELYASADTSLPDGENDDTEIIIQVNGERITISSKQSGLIELDEIQTLVLKKFLSI